MRRLGVAGAAISMTVIVGLGVVASRTGSPPAGAGVDVTTASSSSVRTTSSSGRGPTAPGSTAPSRTPDSTTTSTTVAAATTTTAPALVPLDPLRISTLVDALAPYPGTLVPPHPPPITGDEAADARIRGMAEARGYRLRPIAQVGTVTVDGVPVHPAAAPDLVALLDEMRGLGMTVSARSAFRSVDTQRDIFLRELGEQAVARVGRSYTSGEIAGGAADEAIQAVLRFHSIPGYSRHHTGLAVDFESGRGPLSNFEGTAAEEWLRADGFANARRWGFLPSYPRGGDPQGPSPEPWEYIYVGRAAISCALTAGPAAEDLAGCAEPG